MISDSTYTGSSVPSGDHFLSNNRYQPCVCLYCFLEAVHIHITCYDDKVIIMSSSSVILRTSRSGLVVACLPAAREGPGSNRAADKSLCFHENYCDMQFWARAAH